MNLLVSVAAGLVLAGLAVAPAAAERLPELPRLGIAADDISVVGVSSGGYMATQLAVAWPERFAGLAVLGAGPWSCAQGALRLALGQCMTTRLGAPELDELANRHREYVERGLVGDPQALARLRVFIWHGTEDDTVSPALGRALAEQMQGWLESPEEQLQLTESEAIGHGWPVATREETPVDILAGCRAGGGTHLLACGLDIAGEALGWLHGALDPPAETAPLDHLTRFTQAPFLDGKGFDEAGYLFVPEGCEEGDCGLTVVLHGCTMGAGQIGDAFVRHSGLNEWAATNRRVILYPQADTSLANPQGCWDWWGFAESTWQLDPLHDTREGTQTRALMGMIDRLAQSPEA
ncbi:PHB depolymerase family esterase [Halomonas heilongjiangensis]|uniref:Poly(3-hydroxybutyrate) depolymerase n=1 Tax=Halomonas heilongjiangensis TaxID=1387883 RepID=A0A2N7TIQ1_9GAMM|nr:PHB depolymerase family esterase [Halomonas heilongjiangensis]PMR68060.1 poly(3-hydroxybutyrate) depolymerase [Halomonas heilongjiangensis]PXX92188.1 poly(3-hydroxybutyrate) depolymerase [Halomonas heilongjiangensis]